MRLSLAIAIVIALSGALPVTGAEVTLKDFHGQWRGAEVTLEGDPLGIELRPEDLNLAIASEDDGFRLHWIALERDPATGTFVRRENEASFRPTERPGVFAYDEEAGSLLDRLFASPATGNPLAGETLLWARLDGPTLIVYSLGLTPAGGFELHRAARTLQDGAMSLEHSIRTENRAGIAVRGQLQSAGD